MDHLPPVFWDLGNLVEDDCSRDEMEHRKAEASEKGGEYGTPSLENEAEDSNAREGHAYD